MKYTNFERQNLKPLNNLCRSNNYGRYYQSREYVFTKTGAQPSVAKSVMIAVIGFMMQKGIGNMFTSGGSGGSGGGIMSAISNVIGGNNENMSQDHDLVKDVQQSCNIQDPQEATRYTQEAVSVMNEHGSSNPQGLQSLLSNLTGGGSKGSALEGIGEQQDQKKKNGLLGDVMSGLGI